VRNGLGGSQGDGTSALRGADPLDAYTAEALKSERILFETKTPPLYGPGVTDDEALAKFVGRIEEISMTEVSEWRADLARPASSAT
jgi:hypothetical protein